MHAYIAPMSTMAIARPPKPPSASPKFQPE